MTAPHTMATFESLQERLAALQETTSQLRELIDRLAHISFQPGSVPLSTSDEDNVAAELGAEIGQILREEEEDLELLQEEIIDLRASRPGSEAEHRKTRLKEGAHRLQAELKECRTAFRKAQLSARRSLDAAQKLERELLLASYAAAASPSSSTVLTNPDNNNNNNNNHSDPTTTTTTDDPRAQLFTPRDRRRQQNNTHKPLPGDAALSASHDITLSLRRTHSLIAGELAKSAFAAQTLAESSAALAELQHSYEGMAGLLTRSRELVGDLVRAQKSDTWYLQMALRLLLATLAWLVFRRWMYGPLWWLVWLPVRTGWRVGKGVVTVGGGARQGGGRMEVVDEGGRTVVVGVGEEGALPTVRVGREDKTGEPDSMVERVGRMVEDTLDRRDEEEANRTEGDELEDGPNPMKRMWEEEGVPEAEAVRDEL